MSALERVVCTQLVDGLVTETLIQSAIYLVKWLFEPVKQSVNHLLICVYGFVNLNEFVSK